MRTFIFAAAFAAVSANAEIVEPGLGFDIANTLATIVGAEISTHVSLEDLKVEAKDVYILSKPPNVQGCLSALSGIPLTRQPTPFEAGVDRMDINGYQAAQSQMEASKIAVEKETMKPLDLTRNTTRGANPTMVENLPPMYQSLVYIIPLALIHFLLLPASIFGLQYSKTQPYVKKTLPIVVFYFGLNSILILFINVLPIPSFIGISLALFGGSILALFSLRSMGSIEIYRHIPVLARVMKEPLGWVACIKLFAFLIMNFAYVLISSMISTPFGIFGLVTSNIAIAGLLYFSFLSIGSTIIILSIWKENLDSGKVQNMVLSLICAYFIVACISFLLNVTSVYAHFGTFIPLDPVSFFQVSNAIDLSGSTAIMLLILALLWVSGYSLLNAMDEKGAVVKSLSSLSLATLSEASKSLTEFELE